MEVRHAVEGALTQCGRQHGRRIWRIRMVYSYVCVARFPSHRWLSVVVNGKQLHRTVTHRHGTCTRTDNANHVAVLTENAVPASDCIWNKHLRQQSAIERQPLTSGATEIKSWRVAKTSSNRSVIGAPH